jgi:hypothetical protein
VVQHEKAADLAGVNMLLTLGKISDMFTTFALKRFSALTFPIRQAFQNAQLIKQLEEQFKLFEAQRLELCQRHGKLDSEKNIYTFPTPESANEFNKDLKELRSLEVGPFKFDPISIDSLGSNQLSGADLLVLFPLFKEDT